MVNVDPYNILILQLKVRYVDQRYIDECETHSTIIVIIQHIYASVAYIIAVDLLHIQLVFHS